MIKPCVPRFSSFELNSLALECPESLADEELLLLLNEQVAGSGQALLFDELYRRYRIRVHRWCYRIVRDRSAAHDLSQEVFLKAWRRIGGYRGDAKVSTWMFSVTRNHCLTALKRKHADPLRACAPFPAFLSDASASDPNVEIELLQRYRQLRGTMARLLTPLEQQILLRHYGYGISLADLTAEFGLSNPSGAKAHIVNARRKLKREFETNPELTATPHHAQAA